MDILEKTLSEIIDIYIDSDYTNDNDKLIELNAKCEWLSNRLIDIKNDSNLKYKLKVRL